MPTGLDPFDPAVQPIPLRWLMIRPALTMLSPVVCRSNQAVLEPIPPKISERRPAPFVQAVVLHLNYVMR